MPKAWLILSAICVMLFCGPVARAQDKIEIYAGFSYLRPAVTLDLNSTNCPGGVPPCGPPIPTSTHPNMKGWEIAGTYNLNSWLGATVDISGDYAKYDGANLHLQNYLFGPQVRRPGKISPYAHILAGVAHESLAVVTSPGFTNPGTAKAFSAAAGAGIDIRLASFASFRAIQMDYIITRFGAATQSDARASVGFMIHF
ncbi:MAG TPA: outer membrane beta-barrel protein [Candidatus Acidoferrales bacterium]|nr:outer membrane beta-barrel protein [Candidatus Acidoferrales bacterium]